MKRILLALALILLVTPASAATKEELVTKVETALNSIKTMSADFTQVDPDGNISGGKFLLKRPGKFKWEYDNRLPVLIVADGKQLVYYDKKLRETSYVSLKDSLAGFIARKNIKLSGDVELLDIESKSGFIRVQLTQKGKRDEGNLILIFDERDMKLKLIEVEDATGGLTKIMLDKHQIGQEIADKTFIFRDPKFNKDVWERE